MDYEVIAGRVMARLTGAQGGGGKGDHLTLNTWEWPQGVAVYAMMKVYEVTGDRAILEQVAAWYASHLQKGLPERNINTTAPMLALTFLYEQTGRADHRALIADWAQWVMDGLPRTEERGFQHITSDDVNRQQLWDDTLYMTVLFLYRAGTVLGREDWCQEAKYQFLLHIKYLHAQHTGLWYHGFCFEGRHHFGGAFWCRGNSWFTAGAADFLEWIGDDCARELILRTWQEQCAALRKLQDERSGLWHTLLDDPDSYPETSGSAAIAYGMLKGIRLGLLTPDYGPAAQKALRGVLSQVGEDGTVGGVSYGTPMGPDLDFYRNIPIRPTAYGQGLVFLMLTEAMRDRR